MRIEAVELRRVQLPLRTPWRTAHGVEQARELVLVHIRGTDAEGWGECGALSTPGYSPEWTDGAYEVLRRFLVPAVFGSAGDAAVAAVFGSAGDAAVAAVAGNNMAKAALEMAMLDAQLRADGVALATFLGGMRTRVSAGVAVGIVESIGALLDAIDGFVAVGYQRVKLKIEPGHDVVVVRAVRERFPDLPLQVDANASYRPDGAGFDALRALDPYDLLLIEQPFAPDELLAHAELARRATTPVCLDESIESAADARTAIALGACSVVNVKAARVGGLLEAQRVHDVCAGAGVPVWCGGMLESAIGRAANVALATLPDFTLPGDHSASDRYYERDLAAPFVLEDGCLAVPSGPGIGVTPDPAALRDFTLAVETLAP
jgi:O-succinylbenzoate synthase